MIIKNLEELRILREKFKNKKIVFCSGTFDLVHYGHVIFLENCKNYGDIVVAGVASDTILGVNKGRKPVLNEKIRLKTFDSLKPVDYVLLDTVSNEQNKLGLLDAVFDNLRPDIYFVNNGAFNLKYRKNLCAKFGVELITFKKDKTPGFEDISTSKIIEKIKSLKQDQP